MVVMRVGGLVILMCLASCNRGTSSVADCPQPKCPIGAAPEFIASNRGSTSVGGSGDLVGKSGELGIGITTGGEGRCRYVCTAAPCPPGTAPDITIDHYQCVPVVVSATLKDAGAAPVPDAAATIADASSAKPPTPVEHKPTTTQTTPKAPEACPGCMFRNKSGDCVDPPPCGEKCFARESAPSCVCKLPVCSNDRILDTGDCACHDRCEHALRNCRDVANCMDHNDHNACNGMKHWSQDNHCWNDKPDC